MCVVSFDGGVVGGRRRKEWCRRKRRRREGAFEGEKGEIGKRLDIRVKWTF